MLRRSAREPAAVLILPAILLLAAAAAAAAEEALPMPMEVYFTPAELARIAGYGEEPVSSVSVSGQLTFELCLRPGSHLLTLEMPGAKVAVTCESESPTPSNQLDSLAFATTDEYGNFTIDLPPQLHATPDLEKACTVRVLQLPADSCRLRHRSDTYGLRLSSVEDGVRAYTAGVIRLQVSDAPSDHCVGVEHMSERR
ncbi:unnamed protein product [Miscanthus lutarioriparius]|uniref:Uncharacterized protein n=1 Tax=Miscanthus lutarioriparius TaxID=422564 RepID=A0A811MKJ9_9POAL|nr:unnamed protein product [Miscanthus lutarioriparius]